MVVDIRSQINLRPAAWLQQPRFFFLFFRSQKQASFQRLDGTLAETLRERIELRLVASCRQVSLMTCQGPPYTYLSALHGMQNKEMSVVNVILKLSLVDHYSILLYLALGGGYAQSKIGAFIIRSLTSPHKEAIFFCKAKNFIFVILEICTDTNSKTIVSSALKLIVIVREINRHDAPTF